MYTDYLPKYEIFREAVQLLCVQASTLDVFTSVLKTDTHLTMLRNDARSELQSIYDQVRKDLSLPSIPVYLPIRKKVSTRGQAHSICGSPTEIRVYPIEGVRGVSYGNWQPQDIRVCSSKVVFECLKHEIAHVIATHRNGRMDNHDETFVHAYDEINAYFKERGFAQLIDPKLELWGVPQGSFAANIAAQRHNISQGCISSFLMFLSVSFYFIYVLYQLI